MNLPSHRAFLVHLSSDADPARDFFCGRVEHVKSGRRARFNGAEELHFFLTQVLEEEEASDGAAPGDVGIRNNQH